MPRITVKLSAKSSHRLRREQIAQTFTAYLIGCNVYCQGNTYPMEKSGSHNGASWHLDSTNDHWLHFEDDGAMHLDCRYEGQIQVLEAMLALFKVNLASAIDFG